MSVTISTTNKPLNPRAQDLSPKGYNRASLYSGKALDFDGVNDKVTTSLALTSDDVSISFYLNWDDVGTQTIGFVCEGSANDKIMIHTGASGAGVNGLQIAINTTNYSVPQIISEGWNHYLITSNRTNLNIYKNGVLFDSRTTDAGAVDITALTLGIRPIGSAYALNGQIAGFKIFNTALTAAQVSDLYLNPEKIVPDGVANSALKLWLPMMEGAGTTAYDGSGNGNHGTINGATWVSGIGAPVAQSAVIDWNKGTNYLEHTESIATSVYWSGTVTINGRQLDPIGGTNAVEWVSTNTTNHQLFNAQLIAGDCVLSCYVKSDEPCAYLAAHNNGFAVYFDLITQTISATNGSGVSGEIEAFGDWYRIIAYFPSVNTEIQIGFLDAIYTGASVAAWGIPTAIGTSGFIAFPSLIASTTKGPYIPTLATAQTTPVLLPQGLTTGRDITGVNLFENVRNQFALNLDGNSWAEVHDNASLDVTTGLSLEAWVYSSASDATVGDGVLSKWHEGSNKRSFLMYALDFDSFYFFVSNDGAATNSVTFGINSADYEKYNHFVCTFDGTNLKAYVNGALYNTSAATFSSIYNSDKNVAIGNYNIGQTPERKYNNSIALPRIYNRALTATEVSRNYNADRSKFGL